MSSNRTKQSIWEEYTGHIEEHGKVSANNDFEKTQLEKRIAELEKQLKEAEMKAIAFSTM
ncbi:hypothetical protein ACDQ55_21605 [Chitinophaga sp. 30R24]|uniref:hypothetical protein n=1 Tax=Chitinophaga sp. 30R24 TaxID=3248838 RepID=UPI003B913AB0